MKISNKVIAIANLILGIFYIIAPIIFPIFLFPEVTRFYSDFNITTKPSFTFTYIVLGIVGLMGATNLFFGFKILKSKDNKYIKYGITSAIITFILGSLLIGVAHLPVIFSIYNTTSQF